MTPSTAQTPVRRTLAHAALAIAALVGGCGRGSVNDLFDFSGTKLVRVQVSIRLASQDSTAPAANQRADFIVNAFAADARDLQVALGRDGQTPTKDLAVAIDGTGTSFPAVAVVPAALEPDESGAYALHFSAAPATSSQALTAVDGSELQALAGNIRPGTAPTDNPVTLSLASTLAVQLIGNSGATLSTQAAITSYQQVVDLLAERQRSVEALLTNVGTLSVSTFAKAVVAGLQSLIQQDDTLQGQVINAAVAAVGTQDTAQGAATVQVANVLGTWKVAAQAVLARPDSPVVKAFPPAFVSQANEVAARPADASALAPTRVEFTDQDPTANIAGTVFITPPKATAGITGYNIYLGGEELARGRLTMLGHARAGTKPALDVAAVAVPAGASRIWVWPVAAGAELNAACSVHLVNVQDAANAPSDPNSQKPAPLLQFVTGLPTIVGVGDGKVAIRWPDVAHATGYNVYFCEGPFDRSKAHRDLGVHSIYTRSDLTNGLSYTFSVGVVGAGGEGPLSPPLTVVPHPEKKGYAFGEIGPRVVATGDRTVDIQWPDVSGASGFNIYYAQGPVDLATATKVSNVQSIYRVANLTNNTLYCFVVTIMDGATEGPMSRPLNAYPAVPLAAPAWVVATPGGPGTNTVSLNWGAVSGATGYRVLSSPFTGITPNSSSVSGVTPPYQLTAVADGHTQFVAVVATNDFTASPPSEEVAASSGAVVLASNQPASVVVGQSNYTDTTTALSASHFGGPPGGMARDHAHQLLVGDPANNRIVGYQGTPHTNGLSFDFAQGAADLHTAGTIGLGSNNLHGPRAIFMDARRLIIADTGNSRLVVFAPEGPRVWGATNFGVTATQTAGQATIGAPVAVHGSGGRLAVADRVNHRVLLYTGLNRPNGTGADLVLGQTDFLGHQANVPGVSASTLNGPTGVWTDGKRLLVYDAGNRRILVWAAWPTANGQAADHVLGQSSFTAHADNQGGSVGAGTLAASTVDDDLPGVFSNGTQVAASDPGNHRVLVWSTFPTVDGAAADLVLGQASATAAVNPTTPSSTSLGRPTAIHLDVHHLIVTDAAFNRALVFEHDPDSE